MTLTENRRALRTSCFPMNSESTPVNSLLYVELILDAGNVQLLWLQLPSLHWCLWSSLLSSELVPASLLSYRPICPVHSWAPPPEYSPGTRTKTELVTPPCRSPIAPVFLVFGNNIMFIKNKLKIRNLWVLTFSFPPLPKSSLLNSQLYILKLYMMLYRIIYYINILYMILCNIIYSLNI